MKLSTFVAVCTTLSSLAAAVPLEQRDIVMVTITDVVMTTVDVTKTIWADGSSSQPTPAPGVIPEPSAAAAPKPKPHEHEHHKHAHPKPSIQAVPTNAPVPVVTPQPPTPAAKKPKKHKKPAHEHSPLPAPVPTPTPSPTPAPAPAPTPKPAPSPSSSGSGGSGQVFSGQMTHYAVGLGSCGWTSTANQYVVALSWETMNNPANPNLNPLCGRMISISYGGKTQTAKVVDTCEGCVPGDLDMSNGLFSYFAPLSLGRLDGVQWYYIS